MDVFVQVLRKAGWPASRLYHATNSSKDSVQSVAALAPALQSSAEAFASPPPGYTLPFCGSLEFGSHGDGGLRRCLHHESRGDSSSIRRVDADAGEAPDQGTLGVSRTG